MTLRVARRLQLRLRAVERADQRNRVRTRLDRRLKPPEPVGARNCALRDLLILVNEPAEPVASSDPSDLSCGVVRKGSRGRGLAESTVRAVIVVMVRVLLKHGRSMPPVDDQEAVEELAAEGVDEAFGDRVRPRRPHRRPDDPDVDRGEHGVEGRGELGVAVADEEPEPPTSVLEIHQQVARLLAQPGGRGMGGDTEDVDAAGGVLDDEEA